MHGMPGAHKEISGEEKSGCLRFCLYWDWGWGLGFSGFTTGELKTYKQEFKAQAENTSNLVSYQNPTKISKRKGASVGEREKVLTLHLVLLVMCLFKIAFIEGVQFGNGCLGNQRQVSHLPYKQRANYKLFFRRLIVYFLPWQHMKDIC